MIAGEKNERLVTPDLTAGKASPQIPGSILSKDRLQATGTQF